MGPWASYKGVTACGGTLRLSYDGHPGYDYSYGRDTPLYPAITGRVSYRLPGDGIQTSRAAAFHTLTISQSNSEGMVDPNGRRVVYLHLANWLDASGTPVRCGHWKDTGAGNLTCTQTVICSTCPREGDLVSVDRAEPVGYVGNYAFGQWGGQHTYPHLHFEVSKRACPAVGACTAVDPYGWKGATGADPFERATGIKNVWLWAVPDPQP